MGISKKEEESWFILISKAVKGNQKAISDIYTRTYTQGLSVALQMTKNEQDALDVIQEAYISAFRNLNSLKEPEKFKSWFNCIVANKCRDYLRKQKNIPFSELDIEAESNFEETLPNDNEEFSPEESVDYGETKRLVSDILRGLPEEQRLSVLMFYYDGLSIKEIANTLECSENTVKSRLNYARKKIKEEVEMLEKKGTRLYNISPIPFIIWMLKESETNVHASELNKDAIVSTLAHGQSVGSVGKSAVVGGKAIATKVIVTLMAVAVVGTAGAGVSKMLATETTEEIKLTKRSEETVLKDFLKEKGYSYIGNTEFPLEMEKTNGVAGMVMDDPTATKVIGFPDEGYICAKLMDFDLDKEQEILLITVDEVKNASTPVQFLKYKLKMFEADKDKTWRNADQIEMEIQYNVGRTMDFFCDVDRQNSIFVENLNVYPDEWGSTSFSLKEYQYRNEKFSEKEHGLELWTEGAGREKGIYELMLRKYPNYIVYDENDYIEQGMVVFQDEMNSLKFNNIAGLKIPIIDQDDSVMKLCRADIQLNTSNKEFEQWLYTGSGDNYVGVRGVLVDYTVKDSLEETRPITVSNNVKNSLKILAMAYAMDSQAMEGTGERKERELKDFAPGNLFVLTQYLLVQENIMNKEIINDPSQTEPVGSYFYISPEEFEDYFNNTLGCPFPKAEADSYYEKDNSGNYKMEFLRGDFGVIEVAIDNGSMNSKTGIAFSGIWESTMLTGEQKMVDIGVGDPVQMNETVDVSGQVYMKAHLNSKSYLDGYVINTILCE